MTKQSKSQRKREHEKMLKEALSRPGVREMMRLYQNWKQLDRGLDAYRAATKTHQIATITDHANPPEASESD